MNPILEEKGSSPIAQKSRLFGILSRPQVEIEDLIKADKDFANYIANFDADTIDIEVPVTKAFDTLKVQVVALVAVVG